MSLNPEGSWIQWGLAGIATAFSALVGLFVSFGREAAQIYRKKVDALEKEHAAFVAKCVTREELRDELTRRFDDMDIRRLQMHNHNASLLTGIDNRMGGIDTRIGELREDIKDVHKRIDEVRK